MLAKKEFKFRIYEESFYRDDSAISSARIVQMEEDSVVAVIQFRKSKNFWDDLSWSPHYDEICFVMKTIYEAEDYNNYVKTLPEKDRHLSFGTYRDMMRALKTISSSGWLRIGDAEFKLAGEEGNEVVVWRRVKESRKEDEQSS